MSEVESKIKEGYDEKLHYYIPLEWKSEKLGDIAIIVMGQSPSGESYNKSGYGIPVLNGPTEFTNKHPIPIQYTTDITKTSKEGDVLFCVRGSTTGKMNISDQEYCIGRGLAAIRGGDNTTTEYLFFNLQNLATEVLRKAKDMGSTFPNVNSKELFQYKISLPPLPEQQKIVEILSTIDDKIEVIDQQIKHAQELKKGLMQRLLTKGIGHTKFKDSPLGEIPESWEVVKLGEVLTLITYGFTNPMPTTDEGILMVTATNIKEGKLDIQSCRKTSIDAYENLITDKSRPIENDILLTKDGSLGRVALIGNEKMCINQSVALLRCNQLISPIFLNYLLQAPYYQKSMLDDAGGSTIKHIYITRVDKMKIVLPKIEEQKRIADMIGVVENKFWTIVGKKQSYQELKKGLMQKLLTGKIRVKV